VGAAPAGQQAGPVRPQPLQACLRRRTDLCAEREFKESAQVLVATEAAGEGINLQFCWLMSNFDIPWNPVRLEQRMGRTAAQFTNDERADHLGNFLRPADE
jgi:hypothetical protein